jgi:hypothetical protein
VLALQSYGQKKQYVGDTMKALLNKMKAYGLQLMCHNRITHDGCPYVTVDWTDANIIQHASTVSYLGNAICKNKSYALFRSHPSDWAADGIRFAVKLK